jgi:hypothetical protein
VSKRSMMGPPEMLTDSQIPVRLKLSALWVALMLLYIYGDLFGFFEQQTLAQIMAGKAGFIGTQNGLLAAAAVIAVPSVMVFLCLLLPFRVDRWINILFGAAYTIIILVTLPGSWRFYTFLGVIEAVISLLIIWYSWKWPKLAE